MSEVQINGESRSLVEAQPLVSLLEEAGYQGDAFAVAINGEFVPRAQYAETRVAPGDHVDVVAPVVGG